MISFLKLRHLTKTIQSIKCAPSTLNRFFHDEFTQPPQKPNPFIEKKINVPATPTAVAAKYQVFRDDDAPIILDIDEERQRHSNQIEIEETLPDIYADLNLERGVNGVFEIEDLVNVLQKDNAENIFVCTVPKELKYVDYICVVTGRTYRHRRAMAQFVRKMFKLKRQTGDILPKIEGELSKEWMAMDLGNIALHIFSTEARKYYDLESLWTVGSEFDAECTKPNDELVEMYEKHSIYLGDLTPNTSK